MNQDYRGKLMRLFREIMLLYKTPGGLTINELAAKLGYSYRTIYRDLELLEKIGFFPEEVSRGRFTIQGISAESRRFEKNLQFSAEEAGILSRAVSSIPEGHPMKKDILEKLVTFSGMEDVLKVAVKADVSQNVEVLARAVREKKQVKLINYRSSNSQSIRTRNVEPYAFSKDGVFILCYESDAESNKTFKIERIEEVVLQSGKWKNQGKHKLEEEADIFGINGGGRKKIDLRMTLRASNLLKEEFPLARPFLFKEDHTWYRFKAEINSFIGIGRFVLGLIDEIEVIGPKDLKKYLAAKLEKRLF